MSTERLTAAPPALDPPPGASPPRVVAVVPACNEEARVAAVVTSLLERVDRVLLVDDGSRDGTAAAVRALAGPRLELLQHERNRGIGAAMATGYARALELGAELVVKVDADGQMDLTRLPELLGPLERGEADFTKGNRFLGPPGPDRMPPARWLGNVGLGALVRLASGYWHVGDPTNGYTAIRAATLRRLSPASLARDAFFEISLLLELRRLGAVVQDVAVPTIYRGEESSVSLPLALVSFPPRLLLGGLVRWVRQYGVDDFRPTSLLAGCGAMLALWSLHPRGPSVFGLVLGLALLLQALVLDARRQPHAGRPWGPHRPPRWGRGKALLGAALLVAIAAATRPTLRAVPRLLVEGQPPAQADAIWVLAGDHEGRRVQAGVALLQAGWVGERGPLVVSGGQLYGELTWAEVMAQRAIAAGAAPERVLREPRGQTTLDEARLARARLRELGARRVLLVTSPWHSARAARLFRRELGPEIEVVSCPVPARRGDPDWWRDPVATRALATEVLKWLWRGDGG